MERSYIQNLMALKKDIEEKIKEYETGRCVSCGHIRFEKKDDNEEPYQIAIEMKHIMRRYESRSDAERAGRDWWNRKPIVEKESVKFQNFIREKTKEDLLKKVDETIEDLIQIREKLSTFEPEFDEEGNVKYENI